MLTVKQVNSHITGGFWHKWQQVNAQSAIFHQWEQLEKSGCINNFRILAESKPHPRKGWFFADSDAYKWLEAAALILPDNPDPQLERHVEDFIQLIAKTQEPDGYLYTFNQIHFPGTRWVNLQIEHELYCHGHLIEAGVSRFHGSGAEDLLRIAIQAADRIVEDFLGKGPQHTPGHEEIEIALLRLFEVTQQESYLEMAKQFLTLRGRQTGFPLQIIKEFTSNNQRVERAEKLNKALAHAHNESGLHEIPPPNQAEKPPGLGARYFLSAFSGKLLQQHAPLEKQTLPVGHAVRFAYLQTAAAMLDRLSCQPHYLPVLERAWTHMVNRRMYLTGGIGSLPKIEGFGRDFELDPKFAYAETCAALGSLFWNREMGKLTHAAHYYDLFEWQLYNAALVGMGRDGNSYFYNNPLESDGVVQRQSWFEVPCCPSNLSRTFSNLDKDIVDADRFMLYIQQYISSRHTIQMDGHPVELEIISGLPWEGNVEIHFLKTPGEQLRLMLRQPSWSAETTVQINDEGLQKVLGPELTALDPSQAGWIEIERKWESNDKVSINFAMPIRVLEADSRVKSVRGKAALACGPLAYCLESVDNPNVDIFNVELDPSEFRIEFAPTLLGGINLIKAVSVDGEPLTFIPYHSWGNRGKSKMAVFVRLNKT